MRVQHRNCGGGRPVVCKLLHSPLDLFRIVEYIAFVLVSRGSCEQSSTRITDVNKKVCFKNVYSNMYCRNHCLLIFPAHPSDLLFAVVRLGMVVDRYSLNTSANMYISIACQQRSIHWGSKQIGTSFWYTWGRASKSTYPLEVNARIHLRGVRQSSIDSYRPFIKISA